jgi:uncharacterized repeat protein (TIGR01451 family)
VTTSINRSEAVGKYEYTGVFFNPSDEAAVYIGPLNLTKSVSRAQAQIGDRLVYTLSYSNTSDSLTTTNVTLRDAVPVQHVTFQSASGESAYDVASGTISWMLGTLAPGASGSATFTVTVNGFVEDGTIIENVGHISSDQTAEAGSNVVHTSVLAPEVEFTKSAPTVAARGQTITYTLSYENVGGARATGVTIQDSIPASTAYVAGSLAINTGSGWVTLTDADDGDQGAYIPPNLMIAPGVIPGTIAAGEAGQIRFSVRLDDDLPSGSLIQNWATLDQDLDIPRESNLVVTRISDLLIRKAAEQTEVAPGGLISYTLAYDNASTTLPQTGVYVHEPIPDYTSLILGTAYGGDQIEYSWDNGANWSTTVPVTPATHIRWYDAEVPTSSQVTVGFAVQVTTTLPANTTIRNMAHISSTETATYLREWIPSNQVEVATTGSNFAIIHGTVFEDANGDGIRGVGESGIPNVLITLDGVVTKTTDLNGSYAFSTTTAGIHTVVETDPTFYIPTASDGRGADSGDVPKAVEFGPTIGGTADLPSYVSTTPNEVHVDVTLGNSYQVDFGDMLTSSGFASIHGTVFDDGDGDGVRDADELGIPGVPVTLDGVVTKTTDVNGTYAFSTTTAGIHTVVETDLDGYFSTTPNEVYVKVVLGNGHQVEFGDAPTSSGFATIYGTVFEDANSDGVRDADELGIPDVLITLDGVVTRTTELNGTYTFSTTTAITHTVVETDPSDYLSTTPNEVAVDVTLGHGYAVDFGDVSETVPCGKDIYEEDDTFQQAREFVVGTSQAHQFCDDATDWVKLTTRANSVYTITTSSWGQRADTFLALFDTDGHTLLAANDDYTTDYSSRIVWQAPANGIYYSRITNRDGVIGHNTDYDLWIEDQDPLSLYLPVVMRNR